MLFIILFFQFSLQAQIQWYQNQDGNNQPNGTYATSVQPFNSSSFIACYLWSIDNDQYTWKISRTNLNGQEMRCFFVTGTTAIAEVRAGVNNTLYALVRNFPIGQNPEYIVYKLNSQLEILAQRSITFTGDFSIINLNVFEVDRNNNLYLAGDGQYPDGPGFSPASFIMKTDKNLVTKWKKMDSTQTSYTQVHVRENGMVVLVEDFYGFFPDIRITKITSNGIASPKKTIALDPGRLSFRSALDNGDNLLLYGDKSVGATSQGMYLYKLAKQNDAVLYNKTFFTSVGTEFKDLKVDRYGNIFSLVTQNAGSASQLCKISRINSYGGYVVWNKAITYQQDSCILTRLVVNDANRFYAIGEKRCQSWFSGGYALRMKKTGQLEVRYDSPDSTSYLRTHTLMDGIMDGNEQLIAVGNTNDLDTMTYSSTYYRAFAARFRNNNNHNHGCDDEHGKNGAEQSMASMSRSQADETEEVLTPSIALYPNPVQDQLNISGIDAEKFDWVTVYNLQGKLIMKQTVNGSNARFDVSKLPNGMYLVSVRSASSGLERNLKFVIRR